MSRLGVLNDVLCGMAVSCRGMGETIGSMFMSPLERSRGRCDLTTAVLAVSVKTVEAAEAQAHEYTNASRSQSALALHEGAVCRKCLGMHGDAAAPGEHLNDGFGIQLKN
jgi:hypothetical protein